MCHPVFKMKRIHKLYFQLTILTVNVVNSEALSRDALSTWALRVHRPSPEFQNSRSINRKALPCCLFAVFKHIRIGIQFLFFDIYQNDLCDIKYIARESFPVNSLTGDVVIYGNFQKDAIMVGCLEQQARYLPDRYVTHVCFLLKLTTSSHKRQGYDISSKSYAI